MRVLPRISLPAHGVAVLTMGVALIVGALALDLGDTGMAMTFVAGFVLAGIGIGAAQGQPLVVQQTIDRGSATLCAALAIVAAAASSALAAVLLLIAAGFVLAVEAATRWSRPLT